MGRTGQRLCIPGQCLMLSCRARPTGRAVNQAQTRHSSCFVRVQALSCNYAGHMPAHLTRAKFSGLVDPTRPGLHGSRTPCVWTGFIGFDVLASALNSFRPYALYAFSANLAELLKMTNQNPFLSWCRH
jgi:hypothetical protein